MARLFCGLHHKGVQKPRISHIAERSYRKCIHHVQLDIDTEVEKHRIFTSQLLTVLKFWAEISIPALRICEVVEVVQRCLVIDSFECTCMFVAHRICEVLV